MKIYDFCPFFNENLIANIKLEENSANNIITCITESNRTFRNEVKPFNFIKPLDNSGLQYRYFKIDGAKTFKDKRLRLSRHPWYIKYDVNPWVNEAIQRNLAANQVTVEKDDIVILSDIDEVIDRKKIPELLEQVYKYGVITLPLIFNTFYFNLVCTKWGGPARFTYRLFMMTGEKFNKLRCTSDQLRKLGESGKLVDSIHCHKEYAGYHLSWIGDYKNAARKLSAYAHSKHDHIKELYHVDGGINQEALNTKIRNGEPIFPNQVLEINNDIRLLDSVMSRREVLSKYFI